MCPVWAGRPRLKDPSLILPPPPTQPENRSYASVWAPLVFRYPRKTGEGHIRCVQAVRGKQWNILLWSSRKSEPRVLVPLIQTENTREVFRYILMISAPQVSLRYHGYADSRTPQPLGGPNCTRSLATLNYRAWSPLLIWVPPQSVSILTFLIITDKSA